MCGPHRLHRTPSFLLNSLCLTQYTKLQVYRERPFLYSPASPHRLPCTPSEELGLPRTDKTFTQATVATVPPVTWVTRGGVIHSLLDRAASLHLLPLKYTWHYFPTHAKSGTRPCPFTLRPKKKKKKKARGECRPKQLPKNADARDLVLPDWDSISGHIIKQGFICLNFIHTANETEFWNLIGPKVIHFL